jgi:uncharacterized membrane protein
MPIIILSGFAMITGLYGSFATAPWNVHAMMGLGLLMALLFLVVVFVPYARFRRTTDRARMTSNIDAIRKLIGINLILGLVTVVIAALSP